MALCCFVIRDVRVSGRQLSTRGRLCRCSESRVCDVTGRHDNCSCQPAGVAVKVQSNIAEIRWSPCHCVLRSFLPIPMESFQLPLISSLSPISLTLPFPARICESWELCIQNKKSRHTPAELCSIIICQSLSLVSQLLVNFAWFSVRSVINVTCSSRSQAQFGSKRVVIFSLEKYKHNHY